jgi:hypothetical protein
MMNVSPASKRQAVSGAAERSAAPSASFFLFERHRNVGIGAQAHGAVALDLRDKALADIVMMPFMAPGSALDLRSAVLLGQLDAITLDMVDGAHMDAVGADDFGMFLDLGQIDNDVSPVPKMASLERPASASVSTALLS